MSNEYTTGRQRPTQCVLRFVRCTTIDRPKAKCVNVQLLFVSAGCVVQFDTDSVALSWPLKPLQSFSFVVRCLLFARSPQPSSRMCMSLSSLYRIHSIVYTWLLFHCIKVFVFTYIARAIYT